MVTMQTFKIERFAKKKSFVIAGAQPENFHCRGGGMFVELEYFEKYFVKNTFCSRFS